LRTVPALAQGDYVIKIKVVDPNQLPGRVPAIALHRPGNITFAVRRGLTAEEAAYWITKLGSHVDREAADAAVARCQAATVPPLRV
jgi:hypothetical protein